MSAQDKATEMVAALQRAMGPDWQRFSGYPPNPGGWVAHAKLELDTKMMAIGLSVASGGATFEEAIAESERVRQTEADIVAVLGFIWLLRTTIAG